MSPTPAASDAGASPAGPRRVAPMLATAGSPPAGPRYWHEPRFDGWRISAVSDGTRTRLITRGDRDVSCSFPELASAVTVAPGAGRWSSTGS